MTSTRARVASTLSLFILLFSALGPTGALAAARPPAPAVHAASATVGTDSCVGTDACFGATGNIGDNSCNGNRACYNATGDIGNGSCVGSGGICEASTADIGDGSCSSGGAACQHASGTIGDDSCIQTLSCEGAAAVIGDTSCKGGPNACRFLTANVGDKSCRGEQACYAVTAAVGSNSCNGDLVCKASSTVVGDCANNAPGHIPPACIGPVGPDARIRRPGGPLRGNDIYNLNGSDQTTTTSNDAGEHRRLYISIQNDSATADSFTVKATGLAADGFVIRYFLGTSDFDVTAAVEAGTFTTPELAPGAAYRIRARIDLLLCADPEAPVSRLVTATSVADSTSADAVGFVEDRTATGPIGPCDPGAR